MNYRYEISVEIDVSFDHQERATWEHGLVHVRASKEGRIVDFSQRLSFAHLENESLFDHLWKKLSFAIKDELFREYENGEGKT